MWLANAVIIGKLVRREIVPLVPDPNPMTKIRFDYGITVTIRDGVIQAPSPTLTAILDALTGSHP
jgi:hypothetical protein